MGGGHGNKDGDAAKGRESSDEEEMDDAEKERILDLIDRTREKTNIEWKATQQREIESSRESLHRLLLAVRPPLLVHARQDCCFSANLSGSWQPSWIPSP
jgi:hypothetical protein